MPNFAAFAALATRCCLGAAMLASPLLAGCNEEPGGPLGAAPSLGLGVDFVIGDMEMTYRRLVGAEALQFSLTIEEPSGRYIDGYGIKTPFEETVRKVKPSLPMAMRRGKVFLKLASFTQTPHSGEYPVEIWLINEHGAPSNRIQTSVYIQ